MSEILVWTRVIGGDVETELTDAQRKPSYALYAIRIPMPCTSSDLLQTFELLSPLRAPCWVDVQSSIGANVGACRWLLQSCRLLL